MSEESEDALDHSIDQEIQEIEILDSEFNLNINFYPDNYDDDDNDNYEE